MTFPVFRDLLDKIKFHFLLISTQYIIFRA